MTTIQKSKTLPPAATPLPEPRRIQGWKWKQLGGPELWGWAVGVKIGGMKVELQVSPNTGGKAPEYPHPADADWLFEADPFDGAGDLLESDGAFSLEDALMAIEAFALDGRCFRNGAVSGWSSLAFAKCPPPPIPQPRKSTGWEWSRIFSDKMGWINGEVFILSVEGRWAVANQTEKKAPRTFETMRKAFDAAEELLGADKASRAP
jgi:hypothetical protein